MDLVVRRIQASGIPVERFGELVRIGLSPESVSVDTMIDVAAMVIGDREIRSSHLVFVKCEIPREFVAMMMPADLEEPLVMPIVPVDWRAEIAFWHRAINH